MDTLGAEVTKDPQHSLPGISEKKRQGIKIMFDQNKLELGAPHIESTFLSHLYHKSVEDGAITTGEAQFLEKTARKDVALWFGFAKEKCKKEIFSPLTEEEDDCLKNLIPKCTNASLDLMRASIIF
jgi:hypothetical protein